MTITPEALEALSKAATQGLLTIPEPDAHTAPTSAYVNRNDPSVFIACMGKPTSQREADTAFLVTLWNLYRTGHLVLVDDAAVERVAELVELSLLRHGVHQTAVEGTRDDAKDILAAMKVKP